MAQVVPFGNEVAGIFGDDDAKIMRGILVFLY
ncbi:hypothetical protein ALO_20287 [Acetonema longum DSM 6540]|uniref:Uncharacterized protein n=1 Tax=Acetonema longum DSM 6540 TaxID=1009370 RepID=F7NPL2_9FIRM|nr:hypothetical protein ALO_20287 [Acetonema longum DSM 6540]